MTFTNPEIIILVVLALVSALIPARFNPPIRLPVGTFHASDLLLIWLLFVVVFRVFTDKAFYYVKTPLDKPVLLFFGAVIVAMGTSMFRFGVRLQEAQIEVRILMYYLVFFAVTNLIRTRLQLVRLVRGIFVIGLLVASTGIIQVSLGGSILLVDEPLLAGEQLISLKFHPGVVTIYVVLITLICDMALREHHRYRLLRPLQVLVLGVGFLLTFARNFFISATISLAVLTVILQGSQLSRLEWNLFLTAAIAVVAASALALSGQGTRILYYPTAFLNRITSIFSETVLTPDETIVSRWEEISYAWERIVERPVFGIGLWNPYRPPFWAGDRLTRYLHNAYVSIWLKTGLLGLVPFLWLSIRFLRRGFQYWRGVRDHFLRTVTLGFTVAYLGMMVSNVVAPFFVQDWSLTIFGVILGINELILMYNEATDNCVKGSLHDVQQTTAPDWICRTGRVAPAGTRTAADPNLSAFL